MRVALAFAESLNAIYDYAFELPLDYRYREEMPTPPMSRASGSTQYETSISDPSETSISFTPDTPTLSNSNMKTIKSSADIGAAPKKQSTNNNNRNALPNDSERNLAVHAANMNNNPVATDESSMRSISSIATAFPSETETAKTALEPALKGKFTFQLCITILSCAFGSSFQFGFHFGCLNTPEVVIKEWEKRSFLRIHCEKFPEDFIWASTVGALGAGALLSCFFVGYLANRFGRKRTLLGNNAIVLLHCALISFAYYFDIFYILIVARFVIGMNAGINTALSAMYLNECAPINLRGAIGCMEQLFGIFGILFAQIVGLPFMLGNEQNWHLIFYCSLIPLAFQLSVMGLFCTESPKYTYIIKGNVEKAERDLQMLRDKNNVTAELLLLEQEAHVARTHKKHGIWQMCSDAQMRWLLFLALFTAFTVQFSGFGAIEVYSTHIFKKANLSNLQSQLAACGLSVVIVIMIISCIFLVEHPRIGRRCLYISSTAGSALFIALTGIMAQFAGGGVPSIVCVILYIVLYSIGMGSISAVYLNEFFPTESRAAGCGAAMLFQQTFRMIVQFIFPLLELAIGNFTFGIFTLCLLISTSLGFIILPETKNKSQKEIEHSIRKRRRRLTVCCRFLASIVNRCCLRRSTKKT